MNPSEELKVSVKNVLGASDLCRMATQALEATLKMREDGLGNTSDFQAVAKIAEIYALNVIGTSLLLLLRSNEFHQNKPGPFERSGFFQGEN